MFNKTICNQNGTEFLRNIDGMNVIEIISYISQKTGYSIEETKNYIDTLGLLHYTIEDSFGAFDTEHNTPILKETIQIFNEQQSKSDRPQDIIALHPNLKVVEHEEYDKTNHNASVEFGIIDSPDLITNTEFQFSWDYRQENEVQKSLKGKNLFSRVTTSALSNARNFICQHLVKYEKKEMKILKNE